jgi:hypothetical protein
VTRRSAAPTNSGGNEGVVSSTRVPYSLPSDRRQKAAKNGLVCHFFCPARTAIDAISNALTAQQCGNREQFGWVAIWMCRKLQPDANREGLRRRNARTCLVVSHKILGFLETPSSLIASYLDPSARLATGVIEELFGVSAREPSQRPDVTGSLQVFVLDIDRRPTLAFEADGLAAAQQSVATPICGPI